jgi:hypothetical protein
MVAGDATRGRAQKAVMGGVAGEAANQRAFDTAFGVGRTGRRCNYQRQKDKTRKDFHRDVNSGALQSQSALSGFGSRLQERETY